MMRAPQHKLVPAPELQRILQQHFRRFVTAVEFVTHEGAPAVRVTFAGEPQTARIVSIR